jgi:hypothetical protein
MSQMNQIINTTPLNYNKPAIVLDAMYYLILNQFKPHPEKLTLYNFNPTTTDTIIKYNNSIWKFVYYMFNSDIAVYINKYGEEIYINNISNENIIRMILRIKLFHLFI